MALKYGRPVMTLNFSRNAKVTRALTSRRPVRPAADDGFEIHSFFYKSNFIRTKALVLAKNLRTS